MDRLIDVYTNVYIYICVYEHIHIMYMDGYIFIHAREDLGRKEPDLQPVTAGFGISIYRYR